MNTIKVKNCLKFPFDTNSSAEEIIKLEPGNLAALDLDPFESLRFDFLKKKDDKVLIGEPIACNKDKDDQIFVSPASGTIVDIIRGEKRRPLKVVIETSGEEYKEFDLSKIGEDFENLASFFSQAGVLPYITKRPFCQIPKPEDRPGAIFIQGFETDPFATPSELKIIGLESEFQKGLEVLSKISEKIFLCCSKESHEKFRSFEYAKTKVFKGAYPASNPSVHISTLFPILKPSDIRWSLGIEGVLLIGHLYKHGRYLNRKIIRLVNQEKGNFESTYFEVNKGAKVDFCFKDKSEQEYEFLSGTYLRGSRLAKDGYLGFFHDALMSLRRNKEREFFHFFNVGLNKYTATKTYLSGFFQKQRFTLTTNQHGEIRPFVDADIYQKVMPLDVPVMDLVKAIMAEEFELAIELGLLEIVPEDFILPTFICPSKIEMVEIVKAGFDKYVSEYLV